MKTFVRALTSVLCLSAALTAPPLVAQAPAAASKNVETEPIRCWWRTSAGAIRTGEHFSLVLTCAVLENDAVQVVPDEARLGSSVIQLAPFEIVGGNHPTDLRTDDRRFFQYEYTLRLINPDFIGRYVRIPDLLLHYRVNSRLQGNTSLQGKDNTYLMPTITLPVVSMVPPDAPDIRDGATESFATSESLGTRARALQITALTLSIIGAILAVVALYRLVTRARRRSRVEGQPVGDYAVARLAAAELGNVRQTVESGGWSPALLDRALTATRIAAAAGAGRMVNQRLVTAAEAGNGLLTKRARRGKTAIISSAIIPAQIDGSSPELRDALTVLTTAQYSRNGLGDRAALDGALSTAIDTARGVSSSLVWPKPQFKRLIARLTGRGATPAGTLGARA